MKTKLLIMVSIFIAMCQVVSAQGMEGLLEECVKSKGTEYIKARDSLLATPRDQLEKFLENKLGDMSSDEYIKLHVNILKERLDKKEIIEEFLNAPWMENEEMRKLLEKYKAFAVELKQSLLSREYPSLGMQEDMLKRHFINYAVKHNLKYVFIEGLLNHLPYQGLEYVPALRGIWGNKSELSFQYEEPGEVQDGGLDEDGKMKKKTLSLNFSYYMAALLKTKNEKLITPIIVHDLKEGKPNANPEYLIYFKERKYLPLMCEYYQKIKRVFPWRELFYIAEKEDVPLIQNYLKTIDWSTYDASIKRSYAPDYLNSLSKEEYKKLCEEDAEIERNLYNEILADVIKLPENELDNKRRFWANNFGKGLNDLCGNSDFAYYDEELAQVKEGQRWEEQYKKRYDEEWKRIDKLIPGIGEFIDGECPVRKSVGIEPLERKTTEELKDMLNKIEKTRKQWETSEICAEQLKETTKEINGILASRELQAKKPNLFNIRLFALGLSSYVYEHEYSEPYPVDIFKLYSGNFVESEEIFCFIPDLSKPRIRTKFLYRGGMKYQENGKDYVLAYPQAENGKRAVMLTSGDVVEIPEEEFLREAQKQGFPLK